MDMDEKSRGGSFEVYSASGSSRGDIIALPSSEERDSVEKDVPNSQSLSGAAEGTSGGKRYHKNSLIPISPRRSKVAAHSHHKLPEGPTTTTITPSEASASHAAGSTATPNLHLSNLMR
ncbi:hypothetical protein CFP56_031123 [Quercus suber]|uniref:Uncharacterized protein n=1 Tax=Quercus suber TaxID=58331 RepID=A0AAW0JKQ0_QUESU